MSSAGAFVSFIQAIFNEFGKSIAQYSFTAAVGLLAGGAGGAKLARLLKQEDLRNVDFRIITEETEIIFQPDGGNSANIRVSIHRKFKMKLLDEKKKGKFRLKIELTDDDIVSGRWLPTCQVFINDTISLPMTYGNSNTEIESGEQKVTFRDTIEVTLDSIETITRKRGFYSLSISNQKDKTNFTWRMKDFGHDALKVKAFASSEDFDLKLLPADMAESIYESVHQVTYFFTWAEELFK